MMRLNIQGWLKQQIETLFNTKSETDLSNVTADGKTAIDGFVMPNFNAGIARAVNATIVASTNCFVFITSANGTSTLNCYVDGLGWSVGGNLYSTSCCSFGMFVRKGHSYATGNVTTYGSWTGTVTEYPCVGG